MSGAQGFSGASVDSVEINGGDGAGGGAGGGAGCYIYPVAFDATTDPGSGTGPGPLPLTYPVLILLGEPGVSDIFYVEAEDGDFLVAADQEPFVVPPGRKR